MKIRSHPLFAGAVMLVSAAHGVAEEAPFRQFDFGAFHRCALTAAGAVQCLGESNVFGQVGDGSTGDRAYYRPVTVIAAGASKVVTGSFFSCAIVAGALRCWGDVSATEGAPGKPHTLITSGVSDAAAGDDRVCAIVGDAAQCIGTGGQSGSRDYQQLHPVPYTEIEHGVHAIAVGHMHACAVAGDALWCWGDVPFDASDQHGRLTRTAMPVRVIAHGVSGVAAGAGHDCAIVDGALWCWGDNTRGQLGIGSDAMSANLSPDLPQRDVAPAHKKAKAPTRSPPRTATFADGAQYCYAPAGRVDSCWVSQPVRVIERGVTRVFAGGDQTCALVDGALQCWGGNAFGQLGIAASGEQVVTPTVVIAHGVSELALSGTRSCALVDGALQCTRRCVQRDGGGACRPESPGFDVKDLAFGVSDAQARLGVWRGTIGTQAVSVCLQRGQADSVYYYVRHRVTIPLTAVGTDRAEWKEGSDEAPTGIWHLDAAHDDHLDGVWSAPGAARQQPIKLTRVRVDGDAADGCSGLESGTTQSAFNAPRVSAVKLAESVGSDGTRTVSAFDKQLSAVELPDGAPHAQQFNAAMRSWLNEQIGEYFGCAEATVGQNAVDFNQQREIELRAGTWLVLRESYELYCGGAHPSGGVSYQTWDLASGKPLDPWTWIRDSKVKCDYSSDCGNAAPAKLNALIVAAASRNKDDDECADSVNQNSSYGLRPSATGLVFTTQFAHVIQACDEDIELSYAQLEPFLTKQGKQQLQSLIDAAAKH